MMQLSLMGLLRQYYRDNVTGYLVDWRLNSVANSMNEKFHFLIGGDYLDCEKSVMRTHFINYKTGLAYRLASDKARRNHDTQLANLSFLLGLHPAFSDHGVGDLHERRNALLKEKNKSEK